MLDWTTSFLSDETIIKPVRKSVKHFLEGYKIWGPGRRKAQLLAAMARKMPRNFLRGIDENQEATPVT
jgi:hypothetical protein